MNAPLTSTFALNQGQVDAAEGFFRFLFSEDKELIVSGPAGTGKTLLMGHMIDTIMPRYQESCAMMGIDAEYDSVMMTATTNKAAEVLSLASQRPTKTVHSFLGLKVKDDYTTGKSTLTKTNGWKVHERLILFVDEAGMIDTPLLKAIHEGTMKSKIVYVGDHCQLAPVMESISPIYKQGAPFYELTEQMRTNVPELQAVNQQLRNTVETGIFHPIKIVPGIIDWLTPEQLQAQLAQTFAQQTLDSRILAYTNRRVIQFNDHIRDQIRGLPSEFTVGEQLVASTAYHLKTRMLSVEEEVTIIRAAARTEMVPIDEDNGVYLEVRRVDLESRIGEIFSDIPLPVDRAHHAGLLDYYQKVGKATRNWSRYYDLKNGYPELRQRDAGTVYKAQGSTYTTSFIDLGDISEVRQVDQAARMLYVAFSRARRRVFLYGNLAAKYGGLIH